MYRYEQCEINGQGTFPAGTSAFAMITVLEKRTRKCPSEIDMVTTPSGELVYVVQNE